METKRDLPIRVVVSLYMGQTVRYPGNTTVQSTPFCQSAMADTAVVVPALKVTCATIAGFQISHLADARQAA